MSFSKQQASFSSNFASLFSVMKDNSSVLFLAQTIHKGRGGREVEGDDLNK